MSTQLFLRVTASELGTTGKLALLTTRGTGSTLATTNTAASGTNLAVTNTAAGTAISWWLHVGAAVTISGGITINLRGMMSNALANAGAGIWIQRFAPDGVTVGASLLNDITIPVAGATAYAVGTDAAKNIVATPTSVAFAAGDWIKVTLKVRNVGTMAAGYTVVNTYNGATAAAAGDTYVTFTETIVPYGPEVLTAKLPGPPTASLAATMVNPGAWAASKLPLLTSQNSGTNNNFAAWAASLPLLTGQIVDVNVPAVLQSTVDDQGATSDVAQTATLGQLTRGSVVIAVATVASSTLDPVITDDQNLAWSPIPTTVYTATMGKRINIYWAWNTSTAAALNVTATYSAAATSRTLSLTEVRGLDPNPNVQPWDNFTGLTNSASTASLATAAIRTWTPGEFIFAVAATTGTAQPTLTSGATPTQDTWAATSKILTEYRSVRGTADVTMAISQAPAGAASIVAVSFLPSGKHSPQVSGGQTWTSGSDGLTLPNPPARGSTYKLVAWVFVNWADATPHVVGDVTVTGYINAGFIYATDGVTGHALWVGWRDSVGGDAAGVVHATGAQAVAGTTQTVGYAVGAPRPFGMPWVAPGPQGATTFGAGGGPVSVPGPVPADQWGLNSAFINSLTSGPAVVGSPPINWVQQGSTGSARYLWQAPLNSPSQETVTVTPQGGAAATVLSGLIDNGLPGQVAAIAARLPLATTALTGTMTDQAAWPAANLPVLTGQTVATQVNGGVWGGQLASALTNQTTATQVNPAVAAAVRLPVLTGLLAGYDFQAAVVGGQVASVLTGAIAGYDFNAAVTAPGLPRLQSQIDDGLTPHTRQTALDDQGATSGTTQSAVLNTQTLTAGSMLIAAFVVLDSTQNPTITDSLGLTWTFVSAYFDSITSRRIGCYWARNTTAAAGVTVTATYGTAATSRVLLLREVTGLDTSATCVDVAPAAKASSAVTPASNNMLTTTPGDFELVVMASSFSSPIVGTAGSVVDQYAATTHVAAGYKTQVGLGVNTVSLTYPSGIAYNNFVYTVAFKPVGTHTPWLSGVSSVVAGPSGVTVAVPGGTAPGSKLIVYASVLWNDTTPHTLNDVNVNGFTYAGFAYFTDGTTGQGLWAGWRDAGLSETTYAVTAVGTVSTASAVVSRLGYDPPGPPVGSPFGDQGLVSGGTFGAGGGQLFLPPGTPNSPWVLDTVFYYGNSNPPAVFVPGSVVVGNGSNAGRYLYTAPGQNDQPVTVQVNPNSNGPQFYATALLGQVTNFGPTALKGTLSASLPRLTAQVNDVTGVVVAGRLPLLTTAQTGTQVNVGGWASPSPQLASVLTSAVAGTQVNGGVWGGQLASALTSQTVGVSTCPAVVAPNLPLLISSLFAGNVVGTVVQLLPLLQGSVTGALGPVTGATQSPNLPLLTNQTSADNINQAVLAGTLPHPLTNQTTAYQAVPGGTISYLTTPLLTTALTGTMTVPGVTPARLPVLQGAVVGLQAGTGSLDAKLPLLTNGTQVTQVNQASVSGQVASVLTAQLAGAASNPVAVAASVPLLAAAMDNLNHAVCAASVPLLTAQLIATVQVQTAVTGGTFPLMVTALFGTPVVGADLSTAALPLLTTQLTADFVVDGVTHALLPLMRTHLRGDSLGAVYLDVTVSAAGTRAAGMRVGSGATHTLTLAGAAGTRADTVAAGDTRTTVFAGDTREERGPR